ncbi:MAG TPA: hypothetical protein VK083_22320 [Nocardia sp.]|uniref:hypothetical protein n=1 Tax=Nocardia sp. TaxID=1821 RepID=UPI002B4B7C6E|nr:hypothetical protein [Nocardia sp.]HLS79526.1 hypothetical protein [Nocardia sp.]
MLVVSTVVFAAACGSGGESSESGSAGAIPTTTRLLEQAPAPDPVTAEGVAVTALREIFTWRPADEEHGESMRRARKYLGPSLIRTLDSAPAEEPSPSLRWAEWAKAGARVEAFTFASGERPPGQGEGAVQQFKIGIEQTVVYPDGRTEALPATTVIATVVETGEGWRLDAFG